MPIYVKHAPGLLAACQKLDGWPKGKRGVSWLAEQPSPPVDSGNVSRALKGDGKYPLPPGLASWLETALKKHGHSLTEFVEERTSSIRANEGPTVVAFTDGHRAFEYVRDKALRVGSGMSDRRARMVVWSCEISKHTIKALVEAGWSVELLVSKPESHAPKPSQNDAHQEHNDNLFRTSTIFMFRNALIDAVTTSEKRGSVQVFGYDGFSAPFRALHVHGVGLAIGVYQKVKGKEGRASNIYGDELPAFFISTDDPAYWAWSRYFEDTFKRLCDGKQAMMVIDHKRAEIHDEWTDKWIKKLKQL